MQPSDAIAIVQAWQDAANRQDIDRLLAVSDPQIEIVGPRGSGYGHQLLKDWLERAGLVLETRRMFCRDNVVVVAQRGVWHNVDTGEIAGEREVASRFRIEGARIVQFARYDRLDQALAEAGLTYDDAIS